MKKRFWIGIAGAAATIVAGALAVPAAHADGRDDRRPPAPPPPPQVVGFVQVCKAALSRDVTGAFVFRIRGGEPSAIRVAVGRCSDSIPVIVDQVIITEEAQRGVTVARISAEPAGTLINSIPSAGQATVRAAGRTPTVVTFGNTTGR
jgi:hypothetical protein